MDDRAAQRGRARIGRYVRQVALAGRAAADGPLPHAPPRKLYRVSEIADHLGITRQTLHNYATIGLITEEDRTPGGQRLFDVSVFDRLVLIQHLKPLHRLSEIRRLLAVPLQGTRVGKPPVARDETRVGEPPVARDDSTPDVENSAPDASGNAKEPPNRERPHA